MVSVQTDSSEATAGEYLNEIEESDSEVVGLRNEFLLLSFVGVLLSFSEDSGQVGVELNHFFVHVGARVGGAVGVA